MITFQLYKDGLYLTAADISNPDGAQVGFLLPNPPQTPPPTFTLTNDAWNDANFEGYFAFFVPASTLPAAQPRDWDTFGTTLSGLFGQTAGAQFGWFTEGAGGVTAVFVLTSRQSGTVIVSSSFQLIFLNVTLSFSSNPMFDSVIVFDETQDATQNSFLFSNPPGSNLVQLTAAPPLVSPQTFFSTSPNMTLPMEGAQAGSVNAAFQLDAPGLAQFEAGLMYFAAPPPDSGDPLTTLKYQVLRVPGVTATQPLLGFEVWLDVLRPLADTRTFFQFTDPVVSSYFADASGNPFALNTTNGGDINTTSRLVFASRPFHTTDEQSFYYLTPAGKFHLAIDAASLPTLPNGLSRMLCGTTGTEFLEASVTGATPDSITFVPKQAAYQTPAAAANQKALSANDRNDADAAPATNTPTFLEDCGGNVTTSWVQFSTTEGSYISQPEQSPLFQQGTSSQSSLAAADSPSDFTVYVLDFLPLPTWQPPQPSKNMKAEAAGPAAAPPVPLVPYAGINTPTPDDIPPFLDMEAKALNPTRKNAFSAAALANAKAAPPSAALADGAPADALTLAMTPQGLIAGLEGDPPLWVTTEIAQSKSGDILQFTGMQTEIRQAFQQNLIFAVISTTKGGSTGTLFEFAGVDQTVDIADWLFSLSPDGTASSDGVPPILLLKFYDGVSISQLVGNLNLWSQADTFNDPAGFTATQAQQYLQGVIQKACEAVYGEGNCTDGAPDSGAKADPTSLYYNFYQAVTDPQFSGVLGLNCNIQLNNLPPAIKGVLGGMTREVNGENVSNIDAFRAHHVGVQINNTTPKSPTPTLEQSALFGLVDYEKPDAASKAQQAGGGVEVFYNFEVEYLRALFANAELRQFSCRINLTINNLFDAQVKLNTAQTAGPTRALRSGADGGDGDDAPNVVVITGSYQAHSTSDDAQSSGQGLYSFVAEGNFVFNFETSPYLDHITLTKLQFSFQQETPDPNDPNTSTLTSSFAIWGSMVFKKFNDPNLFSFKQLVFADLGISVTFDLTINPPAQPTTTLPSLSFAPGDLRFDLAQSTASDESDSMLKLLPFKLRSFLYSQHHDQTLESLNYYTLSSVEGLSGVADTFNYALIFDLDLGSMGGLVGSLSAFKFSVILGWLSEEAGGGICFGIQLPQADGKLEIKIQGVLTLSIELFQLKYVDFKSGDTTEKMLVVVLHNSYMEVLGVRMPPGKGLIDFALFVPMDHRDQLGWLAAYNNGQNGVNPDGENGGGQQIAGARLGRAQLAGAQLDRAQLDRAQVEGQQVESAQVPMLASVDREMDGGGANGGGANGGGDSPVFELIYLGGGQRVGPDPASAPTTFKGFLTFMQGPFWDSVKAGKYADVYHADSNWLVIANFKLLGIVEVGFVFYDYTPFYSLMLNVKDFFNFEITYTKISDSIGMFYANLALPDALRTFQVGAASLTLPSIGVTVYTNGNWKLDVGFPANDDWSRSFQVQAMAGPVPVTGAGGFYIASLSSATSDIFVGTYPSILAFGFAARLGVGKDFTAGPLKAGVSVTFFGIMEGAAGYLSSGATEIFQKPDALSLKGQFGIIGEIYGSIDFKIISASVNVTLQASIGIELKLEPGVSGLDGSILLYVEASVKLSVKVSINLGLFSISISFSFYASFRFQWKMEVGGGTQQTRAALRGEYVALAAMSDGAVAPLALCPGLNAAVTLWFLPELTVVFPDATDAGAPWFACSLGIEFDPQPSSPTPATYKPFETVAAQLITWALSQQGVTGCSGAVTLEQMEQYDQDPTSLVGWIDYPSLVGQLSKFSMTIIVPSAPSGTELHGTPFPMFPFLQLETKGRLNGSNQPDDLSYQFSANNLVTQDYINNQLQAYFNQLFVNQTGGGGGDLLMLAADDDPGTPLVQEIFLDYFTGLIRSGVHQLLQTMQDKQLDASPLDALIQTAIGGGYFASLAGQMSGSFRGGARLPYADGMTVPGGAAQTTDNALYALLWQEFPVENLSPNGGGVSQYTITLTNPEAAQTWVTASDIVHTLTSTDVAPYQGITPGSLTQPSAPAQIPFTNTGPQAFSFQNAIVWTQPQNVSEHLRAFPSQLQQADSAATTKGAAAAEGATTTASLCPFPSNLQQLQGAMTGPVSVLVQSRATGAPYLPGGTPLPPQQFYWATMINLTIKQVPGATGSDSLKDIYALSGASQQDQQLLQQLLDLLDPAGNAPSNPISSIQVLYQTAAGQSGLNSDDFNASDIFVLRTNTTTVSAPPPGPAPMLFMAEAPPPAGVSVGAELDDDYNFLQIVQQAVVTNAPGYYLRYLDKAGNSLPTELFTSGPAPVTLLVSYTPDSTLNTPASPAQVQPYYNAVVLSAPQPGLLYYADTTDPALDTQYIAVAAGSVGVAMTRPESVTMVQPPAALRAAHKLGAARGYTPGELITALHASGVTDEAQMRRMLVEAGAVPAQLNALYSIVTYQVEQSTGFIESNLSAPIQPQQPDDTNGDGDGGDDFNYRIFVPLYNLAEANQPLVPGVPPDRYASIDDSFAIDFFLNDAFGNQLPLPAVFNGTNLYFDRITPVAEWLGIVTAYDFLVDAQTQANTFSVYLTPSAAAFEQLTADQLAATLQLYRTVGDQINGAGVTFYVETNLAVHSDGTMLQVDLSEAQTAFVTGMVAAIITYLEGATPGATFSVPGVSLTIAVTQDAPPPPLFDIAVLFGIQRDPNLISPLLKQGAVIIYPAAQNISSAVAPTVGSSLADDAPPVSISDFAADFVKAFDSYALAVGLNGARQTPQTLSSTARARAQLHALGQPGGASGAGGGSSSGSQSLWAVQRALLDISIGADAHPPGPLYMSPKPLDNTLNTAVVPLPTLPAKIEPPQWPAQQLFSDVDLDLYNRGFFQAVDNILAPASAAQAFEQSRASYDTIASGRELLAEAYGRNEIDWMFNAQSPFTGTTEQLAEGQETFEQQMRAALMAAYSIDTILQFPVSWKATVPAAADDMVSLFGQIQPVAPGSPPDESASGLSTAHVDVRADGPGLLTFLYGTPSIQDTSEANFDLEFNVTHVELYLEPASHTPADAARPSVWLQLVNPYAPGELPHVGPAGQTTTIPLVLRQYPTPPTVISQTGLEGTSSQGGNESSTNPLVEAAAWHFNYTYQAQITAHDQVLSTVTYNSDLRVSSGGGGNQALMDESGVQQYTLFEALARFTAANAVLQPIITNLGSPNWADAVAAFAACVAEVVNNSDWNPSPARAMLTSGGSKPQRIDNYYTITDPPVPDLNNDPATPGQHTITMSWPASQPNVSDALSIIALGPDGTPYSGQVAGTGPNSVTNTYTPDPPLNDNWVVHEVEVDALNVLTTENALTGVQIERNLIVLNDTGDTPWTINNEFVYKTPLVRPSQPVTPFIDNSTPIDVASLPAAGQTSTCPQSSPPSLCQSIFTMMSDLLADPQHMNMLRAAMAQADGNANVNVAGDDPDATRRVKVGCGFAYPLSSAVDGQSGPVPIFPLIPVALARSFDVDIADPPQTDELNQFAAAFAEVIGQWSVANGITFGPSSALTGARLVFDITLYAQLSGLNTPVLRLRNLQLKLTDVAPF